MTVASAPILQKQQSKLPTSMRYERVQDILQNDNLLRTKLSARTHSVDTRFGEKLLFSKEVVEVTEAIHAEGKDAHKVPKHEVLRIALRVMKIMPSNGEVSAIGVRPAAVPTPVAPPPAEKPKTKPKPTQAVKPPAPAPVAKPKKPQPVKAAPKPQAVKPEVKVTKPVRVAKAAKPEAVKETSAAAKPAARTPAAETPEPPIPESELPPERQPLHLPSAFDPRKHPHYNVQSTIYSLLLSGLNLSEHFEKYPGFEDRQRKLELLIKDYLETCDAVKSGA